MGYKVAALDLDFFAPNLDVELDVKESLEGDGNGHVIPSRTPDGLQFVSLGQVYVPDQAVTVNEEAAIYDIEQLLKPGVILWEPLDYMIIDTAPTSSGVIQACFLVPDLVGTIIVSQPSKVSRADLYRSLSLMKDKQVPVIGVVVNQAFYVCPSCGATSAAYDLTPEDIEAVVNKYHVPILGKIPHTSESDKYFDDLAKAVIETSPVTIVKEKRVSALPRKLMSWVGNVIPGGPAREITAKGWENIMAEIDYEKEINELISSVVRMSDMLRSTTNSKEQEQMKGKKATFYIKGSINAILSKYLMVGFNGLMTWRT